MEAGVDVQNYQQRNLADLQSFQRAFEEINQHIGQQARFCAVAASTVMDNVTNESAGAFGLAAIRSALAILEDAATQFEPAAIRLLGAPRAAGETPADYVSRIASMTDGTAESVQRAMRERGLVLMP